MLGKCALVLLSTAAVLGAMSTRLTAETMESALARTYRENPQLNAQRAQVRLTDEYVPQALSGYRPKVGATASAGTQRGTITEQSIIATGRPGPPSTVTQVLTPIAYGASAQQIIFNGLQTANRTRAAESQVQGAREGLRVIEQNVLLSAATVYMDVLRDMGALEIQQGYVAALRKTLDQTNKRFSRGDVTATDVSEAQAQLAGAEAALLAAEANLSASKGRYEAIIGVPPQNLKAAAPVERFAPNSLGKAVQLGDAQNPNVTAAMYGIDVAYLQVKINEGALFPTLTVQASVQQATEPAVLVPNQFNASLLGQLSVPLYQGGAEYSLIRQSKENVGQQRLNLDFTRRQVKANVVQAWAQVVASKGELEKAKEQVKAAEAAVNGLLKEIVVGERTTLDLLIVQQNLVQARTSLITAQHDRVVASYNLLASVGRLSPTVLSLPTEVYDPQVHYQQVRDAWFGIRAPDGQ